MKSITLIMLQLNTTSIKVDNLGTIILFDSTFNTSASKTIRPQPKSKSRPEPFVQLPEFEDAFVFSRIPKRIVYITVIFLGFAYVEMLNLLLVLIQERKKFSSILYKISIIGCVLQVVVIALYTIVLDYQTSSFVMSNVIISWFVLCIGVFTCATNLLVYAFIPLRCHILMKSSNSSLTIPVHVVSAICGALMTALLVLTFLLFFPFANGTIKGTNWSNNPLFKVWMC